MQSSVKILVLAISILAVTAITAVAAPAAPAGPPAAVAGAYRPVRGAAFLNNEATVDRILRRLAAEDPNKAAELKKLRSDDPRRFKKELLEAVAEHRRQSRFRYIDEDEQMRGLRRSSGRMQSPDQMGTGRMGTDRPMEPMMPPRPGRVKRMVRQRIHYRERELIRWLEKNEPSKAKTLSRLKNNNRGRYNRMLSLDMKKYRAIIDASRSNPALAKLLMKDLGLKQQRDELLGKISTSSSDNEKKQFTDELTDVVNQRFDLLVQKKQMRYDALAKRLEDLKLQVEQSKSEVENFKNKKSEYIDSRIEQLLKNPTEFNWD